MQKGQELDPDQQSWHLPHYTNEDGAAVVLQTAPPSTRLVSAQGCDVNGSDSQRPPMCLPKDQTLLPSERHFLVKKKACLPVALLCQTCDDGPGFHS